MSGFAPKIYQQQVLDSVEAYFKACHELPSPSIAFTATTERLWGRGLSYNPLSGFPADMPYFCLRVPTGGGKTWLAAKSVARVNTHLLRCEYSVILWLVPSKPIREQTIKALKDRSHPYHAALREAGPITVLDLEEAKSVTRATLDTSTTIIVATRQAFQVEEEECRKVYQSSGALMHHFDNLSPTQRDELLTDGEGSERTTPYSLANVLRLRRPFVVVDEAHNNRTDRFFKSLSRVNPSCIIEMTATPVPGNNVLYHVAAQELKAEQMIKLPIVLAEHPQGWKECLQDARLTRDRLELATQKEPDYIRPIVLVQAEPKGREATVEVVRQYLIDEEQVPEDQIAVATGSQKELDGIDLFDPATPIRYVITVEALKEGWDCSFAYVLASLQTVNSAKDVEQLLGRVLRMPYARNRSQDELNKDYAHIVADSFAEAAATLKDRMVQNMGFERLETASIIIPQTTLPLAGGGGGSPTPGGSTATAPPIPDCHIELPQVPDTQHWPDEVKQAVKIVQTTQGATALLAGETSHKVLEQAEVFISQAMPAKAREKVKEQFAAHRAMRQAMRAPAQLGLSFAPIPQLCLNLDGHLEVVEKETLSSLGDWSLLDQPVQLAGFAITETVNSFEIDVNGEKVKWRHIDAQQLHLNDVASHVSEQDLVRWLDAQVRQPDIGQPQMQAYLVKMLTHLIKDRGYTLTALVRARFQLAQALAKEIDRLRGLAMVKGFQGRLMEMAVPSLEEMAHYSFQFQPGQYPARQVYQGSYEFNKHFYPVIHDLREKTDKGRVSEEFRCAQAIDSHAKVKQWVRNIERQEKFSFWLPTSTDYFYPDFVAELEDGRVLVVEYKGEPYKTNDDSREKMQVGYQWEHSSGGRCLFLFAQKRDHQGRDVFEQIDHKLS